MDKESSTSTRLIIKNNRRLVEYSNENKESTTLLWFDPNIRSNEDTERTKEQLRSINDFVIFHTDLHQCVPYIQSIDKEKIFLITSGSKAAQVLPLISHLPQVDSIFIFCMQKDKYQYLINEYPKIIGIYDQLDDLCSSIREQIDLFHKQLQTFSIFDHHQKSTKDLSKESAEFLWFQLFHHLIIRLPRNQQAKQQMIDVCRAYYRGNITELKLIDQFEREYRPEDAIHWYSMQSFVYKMINKALRSEDLDQLQTFRFFIGDLSQNLAREHQKILLSNEKILTVYRGTKLDREEFERLKENQGKIISTNGYLSTSRFRLPALDFAQKPTKRTDVIGVLFEIQCNIEQLGTSVIYADIASFSAYPDEKEVLFDLNASFRLESIVDDGSVQLIRTIASNDGEKITKDYIQLTQKETEEKSVAIVFGSLMCNLGEYDKSQRYFEDLLHNPNGEDIAWIEFNIGRALAYKGQWKEARRYYEQVYERMIKTTPVRMTDAAHVMNSIGDVLYRQGLLDEALDYHQQALKIQEKLYPSGHVEIARSLNEIGLVLYQQGKYDQALDYHYQSLAMREKFYPFGHVDIARSLNNIGFIFYRQEKYDEALDYFQRALQTQASFFASDHVEIAKSLNNIGNILEQTGKYDEALDYHQRALKIRRKFYPLGHVVIARSLNNIGSILERQGKHDDALEYQQQALEMQEKFFPSGHADIAKSLNNIGLVLYRQGKYDEALDYYQRALKMREKFFPSGHVDVARSLNNIGLVLADQGKYSEALNYYQQALDVCGRLSPMGHSDRVAIERNIHHITRDH
ncbi:unnamed protein product [Rotaria sp. Silwood1]|nr:unnamed protein product [Rotaria sp. Silwood1]CAF4879318.1 unnamed protein product [Rotaria sp. Silwood1]